MREVMARGWGDRHCGAMSYFEYRVHRVDPAAAAALHAGLEACLTRAREAMKAPVYPRDFEPPPLALPIAK